MVPYNLQLLLEPPAQISQREHPSIAIRPLLRSRISQQSASALHAAGNRKEQGGSGTARWLSAARDLALAGCGG
jgi:hypothetical protein